MKKVTKILAPILVLAMVFAFFGCGSATTATTNKAESSSAEAGSTATGTSPFAAVAKDKIKIGVLYISDKTATSGYTYAHASGIAQMKSTLGLADDQVIELDNVADNDATAINTAINTLVDDDECNIIFATSYGYMDYIEAAAAKYPSVIFCHCSGYKSNGKNFINYFGRINEARYASGVAAGMKLKEMIDAGTITEDQAICGYVAAQNISSAEVTSGLDAFALGVQSVVAAAKVKVAVTNSWYAPTAEKSAAEALVSAGAKIIAQHCDTEQPQLVAAANTNVFGIGYNSNMTIAGQTDKSHITAPIWNWSVYYTQAVKSVIDGTWQPVNYYEGSSVGLVGLSDINTAVAAKGTQEAVDAVFAKAKAGNLTIFAKGTKLAYVDDGNGTPTAVAAGSVLATDLADADITSGKFFNGKNVYVAGVELISFS